jgi:vancomycin permeability regulator SanA
MAVKSKTGFFKRKWLKKVIIVALLWIAVHIAWITVDGLNDNCIQADVAIVLGNTVFCGRGLSPWLQGRVDKSLELYRQGKVKKIFVSGGISRPEDGGCPEGDAMRQYLIEHGVPAGDVISDNLGQNTYLTAKNFIAWNESHHYSSAVVVSQFYHITRCKYILRKLGFRNVQSASSEVRFRDDIMSTLREVPALYKYMIVY